MTGGVGADGRFAGGAVADIWLVCSQVCFSAAYHIYTTARMVSPPRRAAVLPCSSAHRWRVRRTAKAPRASRSGTDWSHPQRGTRAAAPRRHERFAPPSANGPMRRGARFIAASSCRQAGLCRAQTRYAPQCAAPRRGCDAVSLQNRTARSAGPLRGQAGRAHAQRRKPCASQRTTARSRLFACLWMLGRT